MFEIVALVLGICFVSVVGLVVFSCLVFGDGEEESQVLQDKAKMRIFMKKYEEYENKKAG